jgi:DNA-binding NtrC family response regulator
MPQEVEEGVSRDVVLLVDDDPQLRKLLALLLMKDGSYHVLTASNGEEALDLSRHRPEKIDILITDIDMGAMNGIDLYGHIQQDRPEIAVLFISGKADDFRKSIPECPLLEKPFRLQQFLATVAEVSQQLKTKIRRSKSPALSRSDVMLLVTRGPR